VGERYYDSNNTVMTHVSRLREKMPSEPQAKFIKTVWGVATPLRKESGEFIP
jgi:two-component system response regulator VanR